ncbi:nuclear transport factor 2 family protein [Nocardiopsis protaetiae]|uniref:nuclear transport factor 2 family protein n=1 Tax=Nocardiopsis protaetiae TaxID=3382270 RepID=UPI00387B8D1D
MTDTRAVDLDGLPETVAAYLAVHNTGDPEREAALFTADATVVDDGGTHVGIDAVTSWIRRAEAAFTYTATPVGAESAGRDRYTVVLHLEGDFPGGEIDLRHHFTLRDGRIADLVIEP